MIYKLFMIYYQKVFMIYKVNGILPKGAYYLLSIWYTTKRCFYLYSVYDILPKGVYYL